MARRNGLVLPLHPLQLLGWATLAMMTALSYLFIPPYLPWPLLSIVLALGFLLTVIDPSDPLIRGAAAGASEGVIPCADCRCDVHSDSKHCMRCHRCVRRFDHHCKWLNNDIGEANYWGFWALILAMDLACALQLAFAIVGFIKAAEEEASNERSVSIAFLCLLMLISLVVLVAITQLVGFHVYLVREQLTTFEWIKRRKMEKTNLRVNPASTPAEGNRDTDYELHLRDVEATQGLPEADLRTSK